MDYEKLQYYYHSDHLGSASYITNLDGEVVQHIEYVPFGEVFIEERNNTWNTPYLFNGKELDEETGLYYYGARYYNPRISLWYGVDPMAEKYPAHSPYCYTMNNPVMLIDPDGMRTDWIQNNETKEYVWDGNVTNQDETPDGFEYVGSSIKDVKNHFKTNNPISSIFTSPSFGEDRTPWSGEISAYESTMFEKARDYGIKKGIPGAETAYEVLDDVSVFITSFDLINPIGEPLRLDGSISVRGSQEHIESGINGLLTVMPMPSYNIRGFNMAQSNKFFKGTWYNKLSSKVKGKVLKVYNRLMKSYVTPKKVIKQTKSQLEEIRKKEEHG